MTNSGNPSSATTLIHPDSHSRIVIVACFVAVISYGAARLAGSLVIRPEMIWPVWPGCALLVAVLLSSSRKIWPALLFAGLAGFALYDIQEGLPNRAIGLLLVADSIEILIAALGVSYVFGGVPLLNSVKSFAKYSLFALVLAPISVATIATSALNGDSWWVAFFTEALALLTLTPAVLSWMNIPLTAWKKPKARYFEGALMFVGLVTLSYYTFVASGVGERPVLLYSLVPFLLWGALRFGVAGTSNSITVVAFLAVFGAIRGHGPFTDNTPINYVLSLQLFLLVTASSFMVLAAVVEDRKAAEHGVRESAEALRASEERLRLAQQVARIGSFERNLGTGVVSWTPEMESMYGLPPGGFGQTRAAFENLIHPEDRPRIVELVDSALRTGLSTKAEWRAIWPDGSIHWIAGRWQAFMDTSGKPIKVVGVNMDITDLKQAEERLEEYEKAVEGVEDMIGVIDRQYRFLLANRQYLKMREMTSEQVVGRVIPEVVSRELFETVIKPKLDQCFQGKVVRYEMKVVYPTVGERDLSISYFPVQGPGGVDRAACILHDITDRKRADEALSDLTRRLLEAQEQERSRIGRELHDDINQRLAMLAVQLGQIHENPSETQTRLRDLRTELSEISNDVQALSHELHSSKLQYLGAVQGMKSWCQEFGERQRFDVDFKNNVSTVLPSELGVGLFRVLQEAMHNAVKHSGVKRIEVEFLEQAGELHLIITDKGAGFDVAKATQGSGLGLVSMRERVRLLNGTITIESKPSAGTRIHVRVPSGLQRGSSCSAG